MREPYQVVPKEVTLKKLSPVVHQYTWMGVVPALQSIARVEHALAVVVARYDQHIDRSDLNSHVNQLHKQFAAFAEGLLPAGVFDLPGPIYRKLPCPIDVEEVIPEGQKNFTDWEMFHESKEFLESLASGGRCYLDIIVFPSLLRPGELPEV
jgi:hypothetical protein